MPPPYREKGGCPSPCRHVITLLIKKPTPSRPWFRLRACQATTEPPAGAIDGNRGELRVWPAARQTELASTLPCLYSSSPTIPRPLHRAPTASIPVAAARWPPAPSSPAFSLPQPSQGIDPQGPESRSPPAPGRSRPAVRRNLAGPPPDGAREPHCEVPNLPEGLIANRGYF
jgi:Tfp pilus assembly protein FimV